MAIGRKEAFASIDEAVLEHGKSMRRQPNTSAGVEERRKRGSSEGTNATKHMIMAAKEPTSLQELERIGRTLEYTDGLDTFRFPTPEPRVPSPPPTTPHSATFPPVPPSSSPLNYPSPKIGVAIGSPSQAPPSWGRSLTINNISDRTDPLPPSRAPPRPPQPQRSHTVACGLEQPKKKSGWKVFGSLFRRSSSRRGTHCIPAPEHAQTPPSACTPPIRALASSEATSPELPSPRPVSSMRGHSRKASAGTGHMWSAQSTPTDRTSPMPKLKSKMRCSLTPSPRTTPTRASTDMFKTPPERHDSAVESHNANVAGATLGMPRLDLDIPKSEFERYSVMFEKLLSNDSRPSLLERRQSRLHRRISGLERSNGGDVPPPDPSQLSTPSTHLTRSLSIQTGSKQTLGGNGSEATVTSLQRPGPIQRSMTAPPGAISPLTSAFSRGRKDTVETFPSSMDSVDANTIYSENSLPPTPTTMTTCTDTESIGRALGQQESAWDMMTSKPDTIPSPPEHVDESAPEPYPRVKSAEDLERQIVQVSVARQVSVRRAKMRVHKAVATKQPLRPRLVELVGNRKSTAGVLESAADDGEIEALPEQ
ncbi:Hypothetical predicted protein [Lecanosticta acicola]|uniref:Uncharacterized protein n=1 Tax=Lecanosticta acicola TaxID=111012 RepID=A0AAI9E7K4_9PEZI|nr:Hypothetical predicted protein [Lecanosticta acicola]